jgi:hypothetical protein
MEWLHLPLKLKPSKFRATITDLHKSTPIYAKSIPRPMETRKRPRPSNPRRSLDNKNILPFTMGKMTIRSYSVALVYVIAMNLKHLALEITLVASNSIANSFEYFD